MVTGKFLSRLLAVLVLASLLLSGIGPAPGPAPTLAMPASAVDETKVPHYFGPYPNWANSPLTLPDVSVSINGDGTGAAATATVGANGAVTGVTITNPGQGYTAATVSFGGAGTGAAANAVVNLSGAVTAIAVTSAGAGYTAPVVNIGGGGTPTIPASVAAAATHTYNVTVGSATGGTFILTVDAVPTGAIAWNALAADVQTALGNAGITATVTGSGTIVDPWVIVFAAAPASVAMDATGLTQPGLVPVLDASALPSALTDTYNVTVGSASGGTFILTVDAVPTAPIAWNALAADVQTALSNAGVTATVSGSGSIGTPWVVFFAVAPTSVAMDPAGLTQGVADSSAAVGITPDVYNVTVGSASGGSFTLTVDGLTTAAILWNALAADVQTALSNAGITATVTGSGSIIDPWVITFVPAPVSVTMDGALLTQGVVDASVAAAATHTYLVQVGSADSGSFTLTVDAATTGAIAWNALAGDVQTALTAANIAWISVSGTGTSLDPWVIVFAAAPTSVAMDATGLTKAGLVPVLDASALPSALTDTYAVNVGNALAGTFILTVDALATAPIAWNALAADVQNALSLAGIATNSVTGSGSIATPWVIYFAAAPVSVTINGAALIGAPTSGATATAYGGVDALILTNPGSGYTFPTVDFDLPDDPNGVQAKAHPTFDATTGAITGLVIDNPGSGYSAAPNVVIRDGSIFSPINGGSGATAIATLSLQYVTVNTFGSGYTSAPLVSIADAIGTGTGASATASVSAGSIAAINLTAGGTGYMTQGGIKKFQDGLPMLCDPSVGCTDNNLGQHVPLAVPDTTTFTLANGFAADADYYVIALVQHRERMSSSLPATGTLVREYVQLETPANAGWSKHVALANENLDPNVAPTPILLNGQPVYAVDDPHYMGPIIVAQKNKPVRIVFYNLLPSGQAGDLFIPVDTTFMGSGMGPTNMMPPMDMGTVMDGVRNPMCGETTKDRSMCFADTRASIHLHGGITPWISDGSPHQWITPASEATGWPEGVAVRQVPDMVGGNLPAGVPDCSANNDGCTTFYYTNQQSARFMFYHDHAWGITRLNVYAGEAAGYLIRDNVEQALINSGLIPSGASEIPLVIQDRTFVPSAAQMAQQDPTWDYSRWGGEGNLWYEHVYMPAQNPNDPSGMSAFGRWFYGPWFWPPSTPVYGQIANPYYNMDPATNFTTPLAKPCALDDPTSWQYQTDPFCEPPTIPGTPNNSAGMEQFNDTPIVNGTAYPTVTLDPKSYRLRILNAANDRFWNLQWYVADPRTGTDSEVALNPAELAAAQTDPNIFPTPDTTWSPPGPKWIQIGNEGGFLPAPAVVPNQPTTWIIDPTRFDVGNVDQHSLLIAPAERADVIVDFSKFAGKTLIMYNDAPAAFPARISTYDYYTGAPDLSPNGAPTTLPGYGPNTRTVMQVKINAITPAPAYNLAALNAAFRHHANGSGVFESGQNPIIVGQAGYNSAYGTSFAAGGYCSSPTATNKCDGFARINQQGGELFTFDTLIGATSGLWAKLAIPIEPKALHDEMNSTNFEPYGRMSGNIGVEAVPATPAAQNVVLYPFVNPVTEIFNGTSLPTSTTLTPISVGTDGTQIWKITHNGVDTHPIHFHLYDVQVLNRVTWDNIIIPPDANELGWKETVRVSPLEDTYFAIRPIIPVVPFELPNSIRPQNPMMPLGDTSMFNATDPNGNPTTPIVNQLVNFGDEYMIHCHILSHEEMDMMRPVSVAMAPIAPDGLAWSVSGSGNNTVLTLTWNDNSINETEFLIQRTTDGITWTDVGTVLSPLDQPNTHGPRSYADTTFRWNSTSYSYRVVARNVVGYGGAYPSKIAQSVSASIAVIQAPSGLAASLVAGPQVSLTWMDNSTNETGFAVERSTDGVTFAQIGTAPAHNNVGIVPPFVDLNVTLGTTYTYRVAAVNALGSSAYSNLAIITIGIPADPSNLAATAVRQGNNERVTLTWTDNSNNESGFTIQRAADVGFTTGLTTYTVAGNITTFTTPNIARIPYYFRIQANNVLGSSAWVNATPFPIPAAP